MLFISMHLQHPHTGEPDVELADALAHEAVRRGVMMFAMGRGFLEFTPSLCTIDSGYTGKQRVKAVP